MVGGNNQLFTKLTTGQSEQLPPYQVDNWLVRTTTPLPSSQLVSQNNQLFAKFKTGQSKPLTTSLPSSQLVGQNNHLFTKLRTGSYEQLHLYQVHNWSARSGTCSKTTEQQAQTCPPHDTLGPHLWPVNRLRWQGVDRWADSDGKV